MKLKLSNIQLRTITAILQESLYNIPFTTDVEKAFHKAIADELEQSFLSKIIKKKEQYKIELKSYQVLSLQMAVMWDNKNDRYRQSVGDIILEQTDKTLVNLKMK